MEKVNLTLLNIIAKSWSDPEFKERLLANPNHVLAEEGLIVHGAANVRVVEQKNGEMILVLPARPEGELTVHNITSHVVQSAAMTGDFAAMSFAMTSPFKSNAE